MPSRKQASRTPDTLRNMVHRHLLLTVTKSRPISIRGQVDALRSVVDRAVVSDEELIDAVEWCAVQQGLCVHFDARADVAV